MTISTLARRIHRRHNRLRIRRPDATGVIILSRGLLLHRIHRPRHTRLIVVPIHTRLLTLTEAQAIVDAHTLTRP